MQMCALGHKDDEPLSQMTQICMNLNPRLFPSCCLIYSWSELYGRVFLDEEIHPFLVPLYGSRSSAYTHDHLYKTHPRYVDFVFRIHLTSFQWSALLLCDPRFLGSPTFPSGCLDSVC